MIVKSIWDFTVGTTAVSSFVWMPRGRPARTSGRAGCRWLAALRAGALRVTPAASLKTWSLCVCSALRKRMASLLFCVFPGEDGGTREGEGGVVNLSGSALSGEASFARWDCDSCSVLSVRVRVFLEKLYFPALARLSLRTPTFILHAGARGRRTCMLNSWMRPNKRCLCVLFWTRPNRTKGTCTSQ